MTIDWSDREISLIEANEPFEYVLDACRVHDPDSWIVLHRGDIGTERFYAYHPDELLNYWELRLNAERIDLSALVALDLHEYYESFTIPAGAPLPSIEGAYIGQPSQTRVVEIVNLEGQSSPARIGEFQNALAVAGTIGPEFELFQRHASAEADFAEADFAEADFAEADFAEADFAEADFAEADMDGPSETDSEEMIDVVLSAEGPENIAVGKEAEVKARIERKEGAQPLGESTEASISSTEDVIVMILTDNDNLEVVGIPSHSLPPPGEGDARECVFTVKGKTSGRTLVEISFWQRGTICGSIALQINVTKRRRNRSAQRNATEARQVDRAEDADLVIAVREPSSLDPNRFLYEISSPILGWTAMEFPSPPLRSGLDGFKAEVERLYNELESVFSASAQDLQAAREKLDGTGVALARSLFTEDLARELWQQRAKIKTIHLRSFEPYIPWELIKLWKPGSNTIDDRYLGEYNLIRHFSGNSAPRRIPSGNWRYVIGAYSDGSGYEPVGEEQAYFDSDLPARLPAAPIRIEAKKQAIKDALKTGDVDVFHFMCHGEADLNNIASSNLIIGLRAKIGGVTPVKLSTSDVRSSLKLRERRPLVFLNACQTGRLGLSFGQADGWPKVLWDAGAGVVIGTHWKVRSTPAKEFAIAFYDALRERKTLAEAAGAGRARAKESGDISWMAYVVYGDPAARME